MIVECFPMQLIGIFGASNESVYYTQFAVKSFRTYLCMMILPIFFGLDGVLYSMPLSDILTFLIAAVIIWMTYQELSGKKKACTTQDYE